MKYKQYASELKEKIVLEYSSGEINIAKLAEKHSLNRNTLANWIKKAKENQTSFEPLEKNIYQVEMPRIILQHCSRNSQTNRIKSPIFFKNMAYPSMAHNPRMNSFMTS